ALGGQLPGAVLQAARPYGFRSAFNRHLQAPFLRNYLKTRIYCGWLLNPMAALSAQNVLSVTFSHASELFGPAALPSGFSLDLVTNGVLR
ncbi:MAG: hypothetical protein R6V05_12845, partial [Candidatus Brocadiia bacterium]